MEIRILHCLEGARQARGLAVIIDVFRAFTTACVAAMNHALEIVPVADLDLAYELKRQDPSAVLMGERDCRKLPGFDWGNSPADIEHQDFSNRRVIHTTSAGTQGLIAAVQAGAEDVVTGSFANASAVAEYARKRAPALREPVLSLVAMGTAGETESEEDEACARRLRDLAMGREPEAMDAVRETLRRIPSAAKFFDPAQPWAPERDFDLCLTPDFCPFVLRAEPLPGFLVVLRPHPR